MTLEDRLERLASRTPPGDPADVLAAARARAEAGNRRRPSRLSLAAAAAVAVVALAAGALTLFGGDDSSTVRTADATDDGTREDFAPFVMSLRTIQTGDWTTAPATAAEWTLDYTAADEWTMTLDSISDESGAWRPGARISVRDDTLTQTHGPDDAGFTAPAAPPFESLDLFARGRFTGDPESYFGVPVEQATVDARDGFLLSDVRNCDAGTGRPVPGCGDGDGQVTITEFRQFNGDGVPVYDRVYVEATGQTLWQFEALDYRRTGREPAAVGRSADTPDQQVVAVEVDSRVLPRWLPDGYRLAWVDTPTERPGTSADTPLSARPHDYAFGYQADGAAELEVRVMVGSSIDDPETVAAEWNSLVAPTTVGGRPAVGSTDEGRYTQLLVEVDGGVAMITTHPLGESYPDGPNPAMPSREDVDRFASSIAAVSDADWDAALSSSGADVASTFGSKDGAAVVDGAGWSLVHGEFRAPLSVRHAALWVDFGGATGGAAGSGVLGEEDAWHVAISVHEGTRVAWGILPADAETVEVTIDGQVFSVETVALADTAERAFAVDVSRSAGNGTFQATGATGDSVASGPIDTE